MLWSFQCSDLKKGCDTSWNVAGVRNRRWMSTIYVSYPKQLFWGGCIQSNYRRLTPKLPVLLWNKVQVVQEYVLERVFSGRSSACICSCCQRPEPSLSLHVVTLHQALKALRLTGSRASNPAFTPLAFLRRKATWGHSAKGKASRMM